MKRLLIVSAFAAAAAVCAVDAQAAPLGGTGWYQGNYTCTIAHHSQSKLFIQIGRVSARAAVRQYPYYGQATYSSLRRAGFTFSSVSFRGRVASVSLRRGARHGVLTGTGRINGRFVVLTCVRG
jgi:hypothetical protein